MKTQSYFPSGSSEPGNFYPAWEKFIYIAREFP
jgi:hypothetical protein